MEVWLSPALGFDYPNQTARIYGPVRARSVGFPSGMSPKCAPSRFDLRPRSAARSSLADPRHSAHWKSWPVSKKSAARPFQLQHVPEQTLHAQFDGAADPMQKTFAGLMLGYLYGDAIDMAPVVEQFGIHLTSVDEYARSVLGGQA